MFEREDSLVNAISQGQVHVSDRTDPLYEMYSSKGEALGELKESQVAMMYKIKKTQISEAIDSQGFFDFGNVVYVPKGTRFK